MPEIRHSLYRFEISQSEIMGVSVKVYIGGANQGKLDLACIENHKRVEEACICENCGREDIFSAKLIYGLHHYIRRFVFSEEEKDILIERLRAENTQAIIICDEVGCGVVPIDKREREYRELTGRIMTELAKTADEVIRVFCGIGGRIK